MANPAWFNESAYLASKLAQLQSIGETQFTNSLQVQQAIQAAGLTVFEHFQQFSLAERTSPNDVFSTTEYLRAKAIQLNAADGVTTWNESSVALALANAGFTNAFDHYNQFGWQEADFSINPSNSFDAAAYLADKAALDGTTVEATAAAFAAAGLDPVSHFMAYGSAEGLTATLVPADDRVPSDEAGGDTFNLTQNIDTASANIFNAFPVTTLLGVQQTLNSGDNLTASGDNSTLNLLWSGAAGPGGAAVNLVPTITDIENLNVTNAGGPLTLQGGSITGMTSLTSSFSSNDLTLNGIQSALETVTVRADSSPAQSVNIIATSSAAALAADDDEVAVVLEGFGTSSQVAGLLTLQPLTGTNGYETVNIESRNPGNGINVTDLNIEGAATLNVTGDAALNLNSGFAAGVLADSVATVNAAGMGEGGALWVRLGDADLAVTGSAGDDRFIVADGYDEDDVIDGGTDGNDSLGASWADLVGITEQNDNVTSIERLTVLTPKVFGETLRADLFGADVDTVQMRAGGVGVSTIRFNAGENTVLYQNADLFAPGASFNVRANGTGSSDVLNLVLDGDNPDTPNVTEETAVALGSFNLDDPTADNRDIEQLNITVSNGDEVYSLDSLTLPAGGDITITGDTTLNIRGAVTAQTVDASGLTGSAALNMAAISAGADSMTITGAANDDILAGSANADTITGDGGDDFIVTGGGSDSLSGGAGDDTFVINTSLGPNGVTITDFSTGDDAISLLVAGSANVAYNDLTAPGATATTTATFSGVLATLGGAFVDQAGNSASLTTGGALLGAGTRFFSATSVAAATLTTQITAFGVGTYRALVLDTAGNDRGLYVVTYNVTAAGISNQATQAVVLTGNSALAANDITLV